MASFKIIFKSSAEKDLRRIDKKLIPRIVKSIKTLAGNPFPAQSIKLKDTDISYRLRVGDYRVIYQVYKRQKEITVFHIRHRKEAYKK